MAELEQVVSSSDLDWTIVRLNRLNDGPATGRLRTSRVVLATPRAHTRADAATTLLDIVEDSASVRTAINVSGGAHGAAA